LPKLPLHTHVFPLTNSPTISHIKSFFGIHWNTLYGNVYHNQMSLIMNLTLEINQIGYLFSFKSYIYILKLWIVGDLVICRNFYCLCKFHCVDCHESILMVICDWWFFHFGLKWIQASKSHRQVNHCLSLHN
jgi:hypothetical protein